jgi:hypothetical protein
MQGGSMQHKELHKLTFDNFAKSHSFDPLIADNWYKIPKEELLKDKVFFFFCNICTTCLFWD